MNQLEGIDTLYKRWALSGQLSKEDASLVYEKLNAYIDGQLSEVTNLTKNEQPEEGLALLISTTNFLNAVATRIPAVMPRLQRAISNYRSHLQRLAQQLGADSITITAGLPWGVSVGITWKV